MMRKQRQSAPPADVGLSWLSSFHAQARQEMTQEIRRMIRAQMRPKTMLLHVLKLLETRKTEVPSAYTLTE